jgi:hypothetical protein
VASLRLHWIGNRSYVCPGGDCAACVEVPSRWTGFIPISVALAGGQSQLMLLEVTEQAWSRFDGLCRLAGHRELLGWRVSVQRSKSKSPLLIDPIEFGCWSRAPVSVGHVYAALATLYGLPGFGPDETPEAWAERAAVSAGYAIQLAIARERR